MFLNSVVLVYFSCYVFFGRLAKSYATDTATSDRSCPTIQLQRDEAERECRSETYNVDECDRAICGNDKLCIEYHEISNNLQYHPYLPVRDVTNLATKGSGPHLNYQDDDAYIGNNCSIRNLNTNLVNDTSFSPWEYVINRDDNRIPRDILETRCSCNRCLSFNRSLISGRLITVPLMVTRYFNMQDNGSNIFYANFSYGCICEFS